MKIRFFKINYLLIILMLVLYSCVSINKNGYELLSQEQKSKIKIFDESLLINDFLQQEVVDLFQLSPENLKLITKKIDYVLVMRWRPWCSAHKNIEISKFYELSLRHENFYFVLLSESFSFKDITKNVEEIKYMNPVFVYPVSYGNKTKQSRQLFYEQIIKDINLETNVYNDYFLFEKSILKLNTDDSELIEVFLRGKSIN